MTASKQSITDSILLSIARDRGIFYAPRESREGLISALSLLPYGYDDLEVILDHRATAPRTEKRMSVTLRGAINIEDIKAVCSEYRDAAPPEERVSTSQDGTNKFTATVNYPELDYNKTRLLQRREKEADIEFIVRDDETIVRMPANPKARAVTDGLKAALENRMAAQLVTEEIDVSGLATPDLRTQFFTSLIGRMQGYQLHDVMDVKIESKLYGPNTETLDDSDEPEEFISETEAEAKEAMMSVVENIAIKGSLLLNTPEYQQLRQKGFYITSIQWTARQKDTPFDILEFEAGFEFPREGKGFKYNVRGVYRNINGTPTKTRREIPKDQRAGFFTLIERTARRVLSELIQKTNEAGEDED
jgi:hypothetical protein